MSYQETVKATLKLIAEGEFTRINRAVVKLLPEGENTKLNLDWGVVEYLLDEYPDKYFYLGDKNEGKFYEIVDRERFDEGDFFHVLDQDDTTITFITSFYNGGTCLSEMLEENLK